MNEGLNVEANGKKAGTIAAMNTDKIERVMATIRHGIAEEVFDAIDDDGAFEQARDLRQTLCRLELQCAELSALMPHNAEKYQWQLGEEIRAIENRVAVLMKAFPWNFIHEHFDACVMKLVCANNRRALGLENSAIGIRQSAISS